MAQLFVGDVNPGGNAAYDAAVAAALQLGALAEDLFDQAEEAQRCAFAGQAGVWANLRALSWRCEGTPLPEVGMWGVKKGGCGWDGRPRA